MMCLSCDQQATLWSVLLMCCTLGSAHMHAHARTHAHRQTDGQTHTETRGQTYTHTHTRARTPRSRARTIHEQVFAYAVTHTHNTNAYSLSSTQFNLHSPPLSSTLIVISGDGLCRREKSSGDFHHSSCPSRDPLCIR